MEVCYLLLNGELPTADELDKFTYTITRHTMLHEQIATFYRGFRRDAHPMAVMCGVVGALSAFYHDSTDITDPKQRMIASHRLIAKMPTIAAMAYKYTLGQPFMYPQNNLSYTGNFLRMTFGVPAEPYEVNPVIERAMRPDLHPPRRPRAERLDLDRAARRLVGRQSVRLHRRRHRLPLGPGPWRRQRGGAQHAARDRHARPHPRIYRPRQGQERPVPADGLRPPRLQEFRPAREGDAGDRRGGAEGARHLRSGARHRAGAGAIALKDEYFIEKKLYPNVDFYSGVILSAIGFPTDMFTALFALARTVGWVAQWNEMISDPDQKIGRPRQLYTGPAQRDYVPVEQR